MKCFMKKSKCVLLFLFGVGIGIIGTLIYPKVMKRSVSPIINYIDNGEINEDTISIEDSIPIGYRPDSGFIPNAKVAYEVSMPYLYSIYGYSNIVDKKPYNIVLLNKNLWMITGKKNIMSKGGLVKIILRKKDGRVMLITRSK